MGERRGAGRRAAVAGALTVLTLVSGLSGCGGTGDVTAGSDGASSTRTPSAPPSGSTATAVPGDITRSATSTAASPGTGSTVADPGHAVSPPGPRRGPLVPADLLVLSRDTLPDDVVARVQHTRGVTGVVRISMANPSVEDRLLKVVAVDPSVYRNFTPVQSADNQELWRRIAGGEVAVDTALQKALAPDDHGYLTLGADAGAPRIHVGAWAPQITGAVDAVVNEKWGRALGMKPGNALLVTTTTYAPDRVVAPIRQAVGAGVSVQRLDVVAREGLDPDAVQTPVLYGAVAQAVGDYTYAVGAGGRVTPAAAWVRSHIVTRTVPILGSVTCNKAIFPQLEAALRDVVEQGLAAKIHRGEYAGCYYPRFIAGTSSLSNHAFGLALDLNVPGNQRGTAGQMDRGVVAIFERWGFTWGGTWHYTDPMHFEMNRIVHPG